MKNVSHKKTLNAGVAQVHMEPPPFPMIRSKHNHKLDKDFIKLKLSRDLMSDKSNLYAFKMVLFNNGEPE